MGKTMTTDTLPQKIRAPRWRVASSALLILIGVGFVLVALLADRFGYGDDTGFGVGQLLLGLLGIALLLVGYYGRNFLSIYRGAALVFVNTLLLLGFVELGAIAVSRTFQQAKLSGFQDLPYYAAQDWTKAYWGEEKSARGYRYKSYVVWGHLPFTGRMLNINREGFRKTPGADESSASAYRVFAFGGSTMLGWGSPDWGTIPAYLQSGLGATMKRPVCVINLSQDGFTSTQSLVALLLQLQSGNIPDAVIFYDGVNDVIAARESGRPSVHVTLAKIAAKFEEREHPLLTFYKKSRQYALVHNLVNKLKGGSLDPNHESVDDEGKTISTRDVAHSVASVYLANYEIVGALAKKYNFKSFFFLQPHLAVCKKPLTQEERNMRSAIDPALAALAKATYGEIASAVPESAHIWSIADIFDTEERQIWFDDVGHVTPEGNRLVAQKMLALITESSAWSSAKGEREIGRP